VLAPHAKPRAAIVPEAVRPTREPEHEHAFAQPRTLTRKHDDGSAAESLGLLGPRSRDGVKARLVNADSG